METVYIVRLLCNPENLGVKRYVAGNAIFYEVVLNGLDYFDEWLRDETYLYSIGGEIDMWLTELEEKWASIETPPDLILVLIEEGYLYIPLLNALDQWKRKECKVGVAYSIDKRFKGKASPPVGVPRGISKIRKED